MLNRSVFIIISVFLLLSSLGFISATKVNFAGYKVYRVFAESKSDLIRFTRLAAEHDEELDIWHHGSEPRAHLDVLVSPDYLDTFHNYTTSRGFEVTVLIDDVQKIIQQNDEKVRRKFSKVIRRDATGNGGFSLRKYNSLHDIYSWLKHLNQTYKDITFVSEAGKSYEGRTIPVVKIGKDTQYLKPAVWIDAGIHSREWLSISTAMYIVSELVSRYERNDAEIKTLLESIDFYVAPLVNPDGYQYSRKTHRLWRKTRSVNGNVTNAKGKVCVGVDANRNFDHFWGSVREYGDQHPCSDAFPGKQPRSELETAAVSDQLTKLRDRLLAYVTLHAYGQMWLAPWGYRNTKPDHYQRQRDAALRAIDALQSVHGTPYSYGTVSDLLYPASGTSVDFAHSLNVTYSYAIELRPGDAGGGFDGGFRGFLYPETQIISTGEETFAAIKALVEEILHENRNHSTIVDES